MNSDSRHETSRAMFSRSLKRIRHYFNMWRVLTNPRIVGPPLRVFRELRRHSKGQISDTDAGGLEGGLRQRLRSLEFLRRLLRDEKLTRHRGQWVVNSFITNPTAGS